MRTKSKTRCFKSSQLKSKIKSVLRNNPRKSEDQQIQERSIELAERTLDLKGVNRKCMANAEYLSKKKIDTIFSSYKRRVPKQCTIETRLGVAPIYGKVSQTSTMSYHDMARKATRLCKPLSFQGMRSLSRISTPCYLLIRFPFFCGRLKKRHSSDEHYENIVFWQGEYHGLSIYACGNIDNLVHGPKSSEPPLWDPSGDESALRLFCGPYSCEDEFFEVKEERLDELFMNLRTSLHDGTRRGQREGQHTGWRDMLLRCDYVIANEETGETRVFGSPVWSIRICEIPYGWYEVRNLLGSQLCLAEWNDGWTGAYCTIDHRDLQYFNTSETAKRLIGFDKDAWIDDSRIVIRNKKTVGYFNDLQYPESSPKCLSNLKSCIISAREWGRITDS